MLDWRSRPAACCLKTVMDRSSRNLYASSVSSGGQNPHLNPGAVSGRRSPHLSERRPGAGGGPCRGDIFFQFCGSVSVDDEGTEFSRPLEADDYGARIASEISMERLALARSRRIGVDADGRIMARHPFIANCKAMSPTGRRSELDHQTLYHSLSASLPSKQRFTTASIDRNSVEPASELGHEPRRLNRQRISIRL
jgi:hypothetical protein